jgi:Lrp/AsnC family transcriptional regulator for asnA, asnC and gidA
MVSRKDQKIVELLQKDARTPISEISREVGLSENGVRYRLEKLEESGYITSYTALLNPAKFGKNVMAVFNVNTKPTDTKMVITELTKLEELTRVYQTTGQYSVMALGLFGDNQELNTFVTSKLNLEGILDFSVDVVTRKVKDSPFVL